MNTQRTPLVALTVTLMLCSPSARKVESSAKTAQAAQESGSARVTRGGNGQDSAGAWLFGLLVYSEAVSESAEPAVPGPSPSSQEGVNARENFHARYAIAGGTATHRIQIDDTVLKYMYFVAPETLHWYVQMPCYRESDLKTVTAVLSRSELDELAAVVNKSGFLDLPRWCGGKPGEGMSPPYVLSVGSSGVEKQVAYIPHRGLPPSAFLDVAKKLAAVAQARLGHISAYPR